MRLNWPTVTGCIALSLACGTAFTRSSALLAERAVATPAPEQATEESRDTQTAIFAGGCFWGVQGVYQHVRGVRSAVAGYAGGQAGNARYQLVGTGRTGHAEAVRITYDPRKVSYGTLLRIFFSVVADPTTLNAQGPDHGPQYRTAIFPTTPAQRETATRYIAQLEKAHVWKAPIVTRIETGRFFPAEAYHQDFMVRQPDHPYIRFNDLPKLAAFKQIFPDQYRSRPALVSAVAE